jgi:Tc toxin complex TcA C-terminal TcB-binding domain/ABC toxin N-terminal region/Neuraminidase-like domain
VPEERARVVRGRVTRVDGSTLVGVTVSAVDRDLRAEQGLGTATTDADGSYRISYGRAQFARVEKDSADLLLRVLRGTHVIHTSPIMFNVGPDHEVDLVVLGEDPPSEYETLLGELSGLVQGHRLAELTEDRDHDDITFLAGETGRDEVQILFVVLAFRLAARTHVRPEVFYGLFRSNLPTDLADLLSQDIDVCRRGLESAIDENLVPSSLRELLDDIMRQLADLRVEIAVTAPDDAHRPVLADVLSAVGVDPPVQAAFITSYLGHEGGIREFWDGIRANPDLGAHADVLERTLQFAALSGNHLPLVRRLHDLAEAGGVRTLRDLAALGEGGWLALIKGPDGTGVPASVAGDDEQARAQIYASLMSDAMEEAFPSAVLAARLAVEGVAGNGDLAGFLERNEDFDIVGNRLPNYLEDNPNALDGLADPTGTVHELSRVQRVYRCAPRYRQASVLLDDGLDSAFSIVGTGRRAFISSYAGRLGGEGEARRIFERAAQSNAMALHLLAELGGSFNRTPLGVVAASTIVPAPGVPDWEALFGSLDMCACDHCRSVYSPAAYFVDVLHFLGGRPAVSGGFAGDVMLSRRPDLGEIELTCENTNTLLPYVDLVNRVLEAAVVPLPPFAAFDLPAGAIAALNERTITAALAGAFNPALAPSARVTVQEPGQRWLIDDSVASYAVRLEAGSPRVWRRGLQTRGTAKELAANPEYLIAGAYALLRAQVFPWSLPFDLWTSTVRRYLAQLRVGRAELMEVMLGGMAGASASADVAIAAERLGMSPQERRIITAAELTPPREPAEFWGLPVGAAAAWPAEFAPLRMLLERSGLTYQGVLDLLRTSFVNPGGTVALRSTDPEDQATCDPAKLEIIGLDEAALGRLHRFGRLRARLNWSAADLDLAVATLRADVVDDRLDDELIRRLAHVQRLRDRMHLRVDQVLALWSNISIVGEGSLYQRLFQNPSVSSPIDPDFALAGPDLSILIERPAAALISTHAASIEAALRIDATALAAITTPADAGLLAGLPPGDRDALLATRTASDDLNLANLSTIYRVSTLARAVTMSVPDTVRLLELVLVNPFDIARPEQTLRFMQLADLIRSAGFSVAELGYLVRNSSSGRGAASATEAVIAAQLGELRGGLRRIAAEHPADIASDPTGELVRKALSILLAPAGVDLAMSLLDGTWNDDAAAATFIDDHFATFLAPADAKTRLLGAAATLNAGEPRFLYVVTALHAHLRGIQSKQFVIQSLAVGLGLEAQVVERLLSWVVAEGAPGEPALADLLAPALTDDNPERELTATALPDQFATMLRLGKIALVMRTLSLTTTQLGWIIEQGPGAGWYDLRELPISTTPSTSDDFAAFVRLIDLARLRADLPAGEDVLDGMFALVNGGAATQTEVVAFLSDRIGWAGEDIEFLLGPTALNAAFPAVFGDERGIAHLLAGFNLIRRLGVSARQARAWAEPELDSESARAAVQAVKAKYDDDEWLALAPTLRDQLREQQRAALVSYLVSQRDAAGQLRWRDADALYAHFLIDVEMSPCQLTTRIRQAMASAQLFAQRCLMNLEPDVQAAPAGHEGWWAQWRWMKNYRVWEANRKIFLYPENWVEPELRDDKSGIFQEFEDEIAQADITPASAEDAFVHYLEKLDDVAWLDVVAEYHEQEVDPEGDVLHDVLHVIGRSFTSPRRYFYRRRLDGARWTSWEPVGLDIVGDQVVAVVWNRRLHLCWLTLTEKTDEAPITMPLPGDEMDEPTHYWKIQLAWSEYKRGRWVAKRLSEQWVRGEMFSWRELLLPEQAFTCKAYADDAGLTVRVYAYRGMIWPWPLAQFRFDGCGSAPLVELLAWDFGPDAPVVLADGTLMEGMQLVEAPEVPPHTADRLVLQAGTFPTSGENMWDLDNAKQRIPTLQRTPGRFRLLTPAQDEQFASQRPFFYADGRRSYHLTPRSVLIPPRLWYQPDYLDPAGLDQVLQPPPAGGGGGAPPGGGGGTVVGPRTGRSGWPRFVDAARPPTTPAMRAPVTDIGGLLSAPGSHRFVPGYRSTKHYRFEAFSHPFVCSFIRELNRAGIDALLTRANQQLEDDSFAAVYGPLQVVDKPYPPDQVDFTYTGAYSLYNWEVFFHAPLLVADRLMRNQQFAAAQAWFHYIFHPTDTGGGDVPQRYWRTLPFFEAAKSGADQDRIDDLLRRLAEQAADPEMTAMVSDWREHPFKPHAVARLRPSAYQKTVVMRYIDNLLQWGDHLFATDRAEAIDEATQLYVLAADILGRRPEQIPPRATADTQTFNSLRPRLDDFSNALVQIESFLPPSVPNTTATDDQPQLTLPTMLYFCVPSNDKLLRYWDDVADRLFKIRHCMNIAGLVRQLPPFDPEIPPEVLVRAEAAGVDIGSVLSDANAPAPHHRYAVLMQKATQLCGDLKGLGAALLSALEKRDTEELGLLRSTHELEVLNATRAIRQRQVDEATRTLEGLRRTRELAELRYDFYRAIAFMNPSERLQERLAKASRSSVAHQRDVEVIAQVAYLIPDLKVGSLTTAGATSGGSNAGNAIRALAAYIATTASMQSADGNMAGAQGGYQRRFDDWKLQERSAAKEIEQIDQQTAAAELRLAISERELALHEQHMENASELDELMRSKYTNRELYGWMVGQISGVYFQSYRLAYDLAKRAERALRFELGLQESNFVQFGYWDSLKRGLVAGERLHLDLQRMDSAYLDQHSREYELVRHISLAQLDPMALVQLRQTGECFVSLPEALFDLDCPGHYLRRIQSLSLSIPCVTGPYTSVNCTVRQLKSSIRFTSGLANGQYARQQDDLRFADTVGTAESIVTSGGQADGGVFELNPRDERYLPFEGSGVISDWHLALSDEFRQFDYDTIADVIMHVRYTARDGGAELETRALAELVSQVNTMVLADRRQGLALLLSARRDLSNEWPRFLDPGAAVGDQTLAIDLTQNRLPYLFAGRQVRVDTVDIFMSVRAEFAASPDFQNVGTSLVPGTVASTQSLPVTLENGLLHAEWTEGNGALGNWILAAWINNGPNHRRLDANALHDITLIVHYSV